MAYTITLSNGTALPVVLDGVTDTTSTSLVLIGKNYVGYGAFLNQNFAKLLENFSNATAPVNPLSGQIWWDSTQKTLKVYTGTSWKGLASSTVGISAPSNPATGDQWFDTTSGQLKAWNSTAWLVIGPAFTSGQGISGAIAETITDNLGASHVIVRFYIGGVTVGILSKDATFTPSTSILGFATIKPGLNLSAAGNFLFYNDAFNALNLSGVAASNYARTDVAATFNSTVSITNNSGLAVGSSAGGDLTATVTSNSVNLRSTITGKNLNLIAAGQTTPALSVASGTGLVTVAADPVSALGVATKQYVDGAVSLSLSGSDLILLRDGANSVQGVLAPDVTAIRDIGTSSQRFAKVYATGANVAGQIELAGSSSGIKFNDGTVQTTAASSPAAGSITPDRLSAGGPYWTGSGNFGIGTTSPLYKLEVNGPAAAAYLNLNANTASAPVSDAALTKPANGTLAIITNAAERMRIDSSGNVGIGVTSPSAKLHVNGQILTGSGSAASPAFGVGDNNSGFFRISQVDPSIGVAISGVERIRFQSDGIRFVDGSVQTTAAGAGIGVGQTWQGVSRIPGTTYTNTTGKPIMLVARADRNTVSTAGFQITINGVTVPLCFNTNSSGGNSAVGSIIIPIGVSYTLTVLSEPLDGYSIYELR